jgi:hypothetical protein
MCSCSEVELHEIEITPEMIEAGEMALFTSVGEVSVRDDYELIIRNVFRAMIQTSRQFQGMGYLSLPTERDMSQRD